MRINSTHLIFIVILLIICIKMISFTGDIEQVKEHSESDLQRYLTLSRWFIGENTHEPGRTYQYPPLYPILLIPALFIDTEAYVLLLNVILSVLTFIPLYLISRKYTGMVKGILVSAVVVMFNIIFSIKSYGYPIVLSAFLFSWFIYFFMDFEKNKKNFYLASLSFGLLIFTKYVFFYLLPLISTWMLYILIKKEGYDMKKSTTSILKFGIPSAVFFLSWSTRNILLNSISVKGAIGGYSTLLSNNFMGIYPETIPSKLMSIFTYFEPNTIILYFMFFVFGILILHLKKKKIPVFYWFLLVNFIVFFCIPAMTYNRFYLNWRYLSTMTPVYLLLGLIPVINMIRYIN